MFTLQWYVARELFKTFALATIGLTLLFSMGGGVFNMIQAEVLTAVQLGRILGFIIPVAATLMLPVAALFSAAMVYGRLSADNEFDACRASGVNIHRLFAPAVLLALLTGTFTFSFSSFVLPRYAERLNQTLRDDLQNMQRVVLRRLRTEGRIDFMKKYVLSADSAMERRSPDSAAADEPRQVIELRGASFIELDEGKPVRLGTAPIVTFLFRSDPVTRDPFVYARLHDLRLFDQERNQFHQMGDQRLGPVPIPWKFTRKAKWMTLPEMLYYRQRAWELPEMAEKIQRLRALIQEFYFYQDLISALRGPQGAYRFGTAQRGYEIRAEQIPVDRDSGRPRLEKPTVRQWWDGTRRTFQAGSGTLAVERTLGEAYPLIYIKLGNEVSFTDEEQPGKVIRRAAVDLEPLPMPGHVLEKASPSALSDSDLLAWDRPLGLTPRIDDARQAHAASVVVLVHKMTAEIHSRAAFSASVLVLVILGAALGVVFRGGQMLTAFVIAFLPGLLVTILVVTGRQLAVRPDAEAVGLGVIWSGLVLVALGDLVVLGRVLRR